MGRCQGGGHVGDQDDRVGIPSIEGDPGDRARIGSGDLARVIVFP
jgi:hypothetical protein